MRAIQLLALVASLTRTSAASTQSYIIELDDGHDAASFYSVLAENGIKASQRHIMNFTLFTGTSFDLEDTAPTTVQLVQALPMVKKLWSNQQQAVVVESFAVSGQQGGTEAQHLHARQDAANDTWSTHVMTQVDRLQAEGVTGKGVKIGIVDSGVDFNHPALGGCFGPGCLISYGYDFFENKPDPYDNCNGHGTHIAGIIAARSNNPYGFTGVAPGVTLGMYRVAGCTKRVYPDMAMMGINQAYEDGSDIISISSGFGTRWSEDPLAVLVERIVDKGVIVVAAAGNNGKAGLFPAGEGSPAVGHSVASVGSVVNSLVPQNLTLSTYTVGSSTGNETDFGWTVGFRNVAIPWAGTWPLYATSRSGKVTDDACNRLPAGTPDLSDYVVLVRLGQSCTQKTQAQNIYALNGTRIMFYGPTEITQLIDTYLSIPPVGGVVPQSQGERWLNILNGGQNIFLHLQPEVDSNTANWTIIDSPDPAVSGYMSITSSWGMPFELDIKPAFAAPGANILSTWPLDKGGYQIQSGTSMATPFVAGVYALLIEARKTRDPAVLQRVISSVSKPNTYNAASSSLLAPVAWQGAGLIQAFDAAKVTTLLSIQSIAFNDTDHFQPDHTFTITNTASIPQTYKLGYVNTATVYTFFSGDIWNFATPTPPLADDGAAGAIITFSQTTITIPPNTSSNISLTALAPQGLNATRLPVYGGYITINSTAPSVDQLSIPYLGVAGSLYYTPIIDPTGQTFMARDFRQAGEEDAPPGAPQNSTFTVPRPVSAEIPEDLPEEYHIPAIYVTLVMGDVASSVHCLLVPLDIDGELETFDVLGYQAADDFLFNPGVAIDSQGGFNLPFTGMLRRDNSTIVPEGRYEWRILALRIFGDRNRKEDWQTRTFEFNLRYLEE